MSMINDVQRAVENECRGLDPDGDVLPTLLYRNAADERMVLGMATPDELKDEMAMYMTASMLVDEAVEAFYSSFVWMVHETRPDVVAEARKTGGWLGPMPSEHPDRVELAMIAHYTGDGGALYFASVTRSPGTAPTLGDWVIEDFDKVSGRIARSIQAGIQMVATMPDELRATFRMARAADAREGAIRGVIGAMNDEED